MYKESQVNRRENGIKEGTKNEGTKNEVHGPCKRQSGPVEEVKQLGTHNKSSKQAKVQE